jgi:hypothetical protein
VNPVSRLTTAARGNMAESESETRREQQDKIRIEVIAALEEVMTKFQIDWDDLFAMIADEFAEDAGKIDHEEEDTIHDLTLGIVDSMKAASMNYYALGK